ncbi:unnamed protein product [Moneuplotes crassus]|uniref:Uncharacterized protein n=1 Tax=Euplotes crassus TaxID=5936 RepID=A0AAD1U733_EUPCR|nr:unnamed protein product [Moneuplotes crassus]
MVWISAIAVAICCQDGYYSFNNGCKPCDSSCKSCSQDGKCNTCDQFMQLLASNLCGHCPDGEYFDFTSKICRICPSSCDGACAYQSICLDCPSGQSLDLKTLECKTSCNPATQVELTGSQISLASVCRDFEYYVDPTSTEVIELGTQKYPYRTLKSVASEILNYLSHKEVEVTIHTKDVYLEDKTMFFVNITNVKITTHPDLTAYGLKAVLTLTEFPQATISKKAKFHLLTHTDLPFSALITAGDFTDSEKAQAGNFMSNCIVRSGIEFNNIDIYREEVDYNKNNLFLQAIYLQNMDIRFINTFINISGQVLLTTDPFNLVIHDSKIDMYTLTEQFAIYAGCNYPEAHKTATIDVRNYTMMNSKDRTLSENPRGIDSNHAGNWTIRELDATSFYGTVSDISSTISLVQFPYCNPDDDLVRTIDVDGVKFSHGDSNPSKVSGLHSDITVSHYRPIHVIGNNLHFFNLSYPGFPLIAIAGSQIDILNIQSMKVTNCDLIDALFYAIFIKEVTFGDSTKNETSIEMDSMSIKVPSAFLVNYLQKFEFYNLKLTNFTGSPTSNLALIQCLLFQNSVFKVRSLEVDQSNFQTSKLVFASELMNEVVFEDIEITGSTINPSSSLFLLNSIQSLQFVNATFTGVTVVDVNDVDSSIIRIEEYSLQDQLNSNIQNVELSESQVSLFNLVKLSKSAVEEQTFNFTNILFHDMIIPSSRNLIDTSGFVGTGELRVSMDNLTFVRVNYTRSGNNLKFSHSLDHEVTIKNSHFINSDSSSILLDKASDGANVRTEVKFENCTFSNNIVKSKAAVQIRNSVKLIVVNSKFSQIASLFERSTLFHSEGGSELVITNCEFTQNYGLVASLFTIESEAHVKCSNCTINNNFALSGGLIRALSNGYFSIVNSTITQNHAIQASIAQIFDASDTSSVDSSEVFSNSPLLSSEYESEKTSCSELCFLSDEFKEYVATNNLHNLVESQVLFEVISGSFSVRNNSKIYSEQYPILSLMSDIHIDSSMLSNLSFASTSIKVATSLIVLNNVTFDNISTQAGSELILGDIGSVINLTNVHFKSSNALFCRITSSQLDMDRVVIENIHGPKDLIQIENSDKIKLQNIEVINSTVNSDNLIFISRSTQVEINGFFARNNADKNVISITKSHVSLIQNIDIQSSLRALQISQTTIDKINECNFIRNGNIETSVGGAMLMQNSKATVVNSTFSHNVGVKGAAIAFECTSLTLCDLRLDRVNFTNQRASEQGGAINYNYRNPTITNCTFTDNSAQYGPDIASYSVKIRITQDIHSDMSLKDVGSGIGLDYPIKLSLLDFDNQTMIMDNAGQISIFAVDTQSSAVRETNTVQLKNGVSEFDDIQFVSKIGSENVKYRAVSKAIDNNKVDEVFGDSLLSNQISVDFRFCKPGEHIDSQNICAECSAGTYSLKWNSTFCNKCLDNAFCPGKEKIQLYPGYWRNTRNSTEIKECLKSNACKGGFLSNATHPVECAEGYTGNLCSKCIVNEDAKYARTGDFECSKCPEPVFNAIRVIGTGLLVFAFLCYLIIINIRKTKESNLSVLFRILTNYIQIVSTSISLTGDYPNSITTFFSFTDEIGSSSETFLSFDCFVEDYEIKGPFDSNSIFKLFLMGLLPIILFSLVALLMIIFKAIRPSRIKSIERNFVIGFISILFLLHPTMTEQSFGLFRCVEIDKGVSKVRVDMDIECYSARHLKYCLTIAGPIILIWVISLPVIALILLIKYANKPGENKVKIYFLILIQGLNKSSFYWEFVNTARKISVIITFPFNTTTRLFCALAVLIVFTRLNDTLKPYKESSFNSLEISGSNAGIIILAAGLVYSQDEGVNSLNTVMMVIVFTFNTYFILEWTYQFLRLYKKQYKFISPAITLLGKILLKKKLEVSTEATQKKFIGSVVIAKKNKKVKKKLKKARHKHKLRCKHKHKRFFEEKHIRTPHKLEKDASYFKKILAGGVSFDDLSQTDRIFMMSKMSSMRGNKFIKSSERRDAISIVKKMGKAIGDDLNVENCFPLKKSIQPSPMLTDLKEESKSNPSGDSNEIPIASSPNNPDSIILPDLIYELSLESKDNSSKSKKL